MNKRAQFFLIAAFIVIVVFISLALVYISSYSPRDNFEVESIAKNTKFEGTMIINQGYNNNLSDLLISQNLFDFTNITSLSFPTYEITCVIIDQNGNPLAKSFTNGKGLDLSSSLTNLGESVTLNLNTYEFSFNKSRGFNYYVIVISEENDEKYIALE